MVAATWLTATSAAGASHESKQRCVDAASRGQSLRIGGKLVAARDAFMQCAKEECPKVVASHCTGWYEEVLRAIPSLVVKARDARGRDVSDVTVSVDGQRVADSLDGLPIDLDPGPHTLTLVRASRAQTLEERVLLGAGEKNRQLTVTFPGDAPPPAGGSAPTAAVEPSAPNDHAGSAGPPAGAWIFTGVAVAALGAFAYLGATGSSDLHSLRDTCAGHCAESDVDSAWTKLVVSDVALAAAAVSAGVATWLFLSPRGERTPSASVGLAPTPRGGFLHLEARF